MPIGQSAATRAEYDAQAAKATTLPELRELSAQFVTRQRTELLGRLDRVRAEANRRKAEVDLNKAETNRLRDALVHIRDDLEARAPRLVRSDLEELRALVTAALRGGVVAGASPKAGQSPVGASPSVGSTTSPGAVVCIGSAGDSPPTDFGVNAAAETVEKLRSRVLQLERVQKRLEKENEALRERTLLNELELRRTGFATGPLQPLTAGSSTAPSRLRSPRSSPRGSVRSPSPGGTAARGPAVSESLPDAAGDRAAGGGGGSLAAWAEVGGPDSGRQWIGTRESAEKAAVPRWCENPPSATSPVILVPQLPLKQHVQQPSTPQQQQPPQQKQAPPSQLRQPRQMLQLLLQQPPPHQSKPDAEEVVRASSPGPRGGQSPAAGGGIGFMRNTSPKNRRSSLGDLRLQAAAMTEPGSPRSMQHQKSIRSPRSSLPSCGGSVGPQLSYTFANQESASRHEF